MIFHLLLSTMVLVVDTTIMIRNGVGFLWTGEMVPNGEQWNLVSSFDTGKICHGSSTVRRAYKAIDGRVREMFGVAIWEGVVLEKQLKLLEDLEDEIKFLTGTNERVPRGIFNFGGKILKGLVGTATVDDIHGLADKIKLLESSDKHYTRLFLDQITLLNETHQNELLHEQKVNSLIKGYNAILKRLDVAENSTYQDEIRIKQIPELQGNIRYLEILISELISNQKSFVKAFRDLHSGQLSDYFLTPKDLTRTLKKVKDSLEPGLDLITDLNVGVTTWYEIIGASAIITSNGVINIVLSIPLLRKSEVYDSYQVIPIPTRTNGTEWFKTLEGNNEIVIINKERNLFKSFRKASDIQCHRPSVYLEKSICNIDYVFATPDSECELALFFNNSVAASNLCSFRIKKGIKHRVFLKKIADNTYVYSTQESISLSWSCLRSDNQLVQVISGIGVLQIPSKCRCDLRGTDIVISSSSTGSSTFNISTIDDFNILNISANGKIYNMTTIHHSKLMDLLNSTTDNNFGHRLNDVHSRLLQEIEKEKNFDRQEKYNLGSIIAGAVVGSLVLAIIIVIFIFCLVHHKKYSRVQNYLSRLRKLVTANQERRNQREVLPPPPPIPLTQGHGQGQEQNTIQAATRMTDYSFAF